MMESGIGPGGLWALIVLRKPQGDNRAAPLCEMIATPSRYLSLFIFLLLATPLLAGFIMPESGQDVLKEGRTRAPAPSLPRSRDELAAWPKEADAYLGDRFGLRSQMIGWHANVAKRLLGDGNESVLVGRHDRMFLLGEDLVRQSAGLVRRDSRVTETVGFLAAMRDALAQRGIRFLVASPPNAATIYQEDLPYWARSDGKTTEYDLFVADLAGRGIRAVDLRPVVQTVQSEAPAYFLHDTHWTPRAAIAGFNAIAEADGHRDWRVDADAALAPLTQRQGGDLARLIGVSDYVTEPSQEMALSPASEVELTTGPFAAYVATGSQQSKTVMIVGDSFTQHDFAPLLLNHVRRVVWQHHNWCGFDWKLIDRFHPDEVWWMPTERYLLCNPNVRPDGFPSAQQAVIR
jgi:alginate O-acetyltransferase complex protein AlgJ